MLTVGSLYSGIGGLDLGLEWAGLRTIWQCDIDPYCRTVLERHWPGLPRYDDVQQVDFRTVERPDVLAGGFVCTDLSNAGKQAGIHGETRSGVTFRHFIRAVRELRPRYVLMENVPALLSGGRGSWFGAVLGELAESGYDAEWDCIPASALGAPHIRDRVFIVAYPQCTGWDWVHERGEPRHMAANARDGGSNGTGGAAAKGDGSGLQGKGPEGGDASHPVRSGCGEGRTRRPVCGDGQRGAPAAGVSNSRRNGLEGAIHGGNGGPPGGGVFSRSPLAGEHRARGTAWWETEPGMGRLVDGLPPGMDRAEWEGALRGFGNAVVPHVAHYLGTLIVEHAAAMARVA